jgi:uncharacterized protein YcfL
MMLRTKYLTLSAAALAAALALAGGCKSVNTVEREKPTYEANVVNDKRIETDGFLANKAKVLQVRQATVQDNLLKVDVEILNDDPWSGDFDYKFEWFDDQGMPVDSPTSTWYTKHVQARETVSLDEIAPNPRCKDFRLKLQRSIRE